MLFLLLSCCHITALPVNTKLEIKKYEKDGNGQRERARARSPSPPSHTPISLKVGVVLERLENRACVSEVKLLSARANLYVVQTPTPSSKFRSRLRRRTRRQRWLKGSKPVEFLKLFRSQCYRKYLHSIYFLISNASTTIMFEWGAFYLL